jgi:phosphate transport system protein
VEELAGLKTQLLAMGDLAEDNVRVAVDAMIAGDRPRIRKVIDGDQPLNELQISIDDRCFKLLALQHPVAVDLRFVVAATKITGELERVGDLAVNIAEAAERYLEHRPVSPLVDLSEMGTIAQRMLATVLSAFMAQSAALAKKVLAEDDRLDQVREQVVRQLLTDMSRNAMTIEPAVDLILMTRHLERIGAHASNIAEDIIFITEARDVRHARRAPARVSH